MIPLCQSPDISWNFLHCPCKLHVQTNSKSSFSLTAEILIYMGFFLSFKASFEFDHPDYEKQLLRLLGRKDRAGLIINNPSQSMFLFVDRHHLQVSLDDRFVPSAVVGTVLALP